MIGFDFPIRPEWVHDVHLMVEPEMLVDDLVERALSTTMRELGGEETRKKTLGVIMRYLVRTEGHPSSRTRRTATRDALVSASRTHPVITVQPAYLSRILFLNDVAASTTAYVARRYTLGDTLTRADLRRHIVGEFGERKVVLNAVSAYVRSLEAFGIYTETEGRGAYIFSDRLPVTAEIFPLLVLNYFEQKQNPQIDLLAFNDDPTFCYLERDNFSDYWRRYNGYLWSLERRLGSERATLKYPDVAAFEREVIKLL